jgi:hypothetical protein
MPIEYREATYSDYKKGYARLRIDSEVYYYLNGVLHRLDGPACTDYGLEGIGDYWIHGKNITGKDREDLIEALKCPIEKLPLYTNNEKIKPAIMYRLKKENIIL